MVVSLCCTYLKEVKYYCEKRRKETEKTNKKGNGASQGNAVFCTFR